MQPLLCFCLVILLTVLINAQTTTVIDADSGSTVIEVVTADGLGGLTTSIVQTLLGTATASASTSAAAAVTTPDSPEQQGPVGQPAATSFKPGGVTPYTYITVVDGETETLTDNFTPTNPATQPISVTAKGTILDYSSWLAEFGPTSTASGSPNAAYTLVPWSWRGSGGVRAFAVLGGLAVGMGAVLF